MYIHFSIVSQKNASYKSRMGILKEKLLNFEVFFMLGRPISDKHKGFLSFFLPFLLCLTIFTGTAMVGLYTPAPLQKTAQASFSATAVLGQISATLLLGIGETPAQAKYFTLEIKTQLQSAFLEELPANIIPLGGHTAHSGMQTVKQTAAQLSGNPIARYIWLTPQTLADVVDAIGGVILTESRGVRRYAGAEFAELFAKAQTTAPLCRLIEQVLAAKDNLLAVATVLFARGATDLSSPDIFDQKNLLWGISVY